MAKHAVVIYGLTDQFGLVKYVGKTRSPSRRWLGHLLLSRKGLLGFQLEGIAILEMVVAEKDDNEAEKRWIAFYGRENLFNRTNGGNGAWAYPPSDETRKRLSESLREAFKDPDIQRRRKATLLSTGAEALRKAKIGESVRKQWEIPGMRRKRIDGIRAAYRDPVKRARLAASMARALADPEKRERIISGFKKCGTDPEIRRRRAETLRRTMKAKYDLKKAISIIASIPKELRRPQITYL